MDVWQGLVGQEQAIAQLRRIADAQRSVSAADAAHAPSDAAGAPAVPLAHAWLFTGPAGSGRSNLALAFAAALLCPSGGCGTCSSCLMARAGNHPDLRVLRTDKVIIGIDDVRDLVAASYLSPSISRRRVQVIEDADRMIERTSNVLLKAIEEPPESTVWILCSPSEADMLPTIRSRTSAIRLTTPTVLAVSRFLVETDGVDPELAIRCAREAQSHIGMARRLATDHDARERRRSSIEILLGVLSTSHLGKGAADLVGIAETDSTAADETRVDRDRAEFLRQLGLPKDEPVPPQYRAQVRAWDENNKRKATRSLRDGVDRILLDFESVVRDALLLSIGSGTELINADLEGRISEWAAARTPAEILRCLDAIGIARARIAGNVTPLLAIEAMLVSAVDRGAIR